MLSGTYYALTHLASWNLWKETNCEVDYNGDRWIRTLYRRDKGIHKGRRQPILLEKTDRDLRENWANVFFDN